MSFTEKARAFLAARNIQGSATPECDLPEPTAPPEPENFPESLKGCVVELWRNGERFFLVTDEEDARLAIDRLGAARGEVWTGAEIELVVRFQDQAIRDEIEALKRATDGALTADAAKGVPWAEWNATSLNKLFREHGASARQSKDGGKR
jgi:hypothetical protein